MFNPFPDHPVFSDFKHKRLHADTTLIYYPGTGGQFLSGLLCGYRSVDTAVNEYDSLSTWLWPDDNFVIDSPLPTDVVDLDALYARCQRDWYPDAQQSIVAGHLPPVLTYLTHDYSTDQLLCVEASDVDLWYPDILREVKYGFNTAYAQNPLVISDILEDMSANPVPWTFSDYAWMINSVKQIHTGTLDLYNSPVSWKWLLYAKREEIDPTTQAEFRLWFSRFIFGYTRAADDRTPEYYRWAKGSLSSMFDIATIDYARFYFDLDTQGCAVLDSLDIEAVRTYSRQNLDLLFGLMPAITDQMRAELEPKLWDYSYRLTNARRW